MKEKIQEIMCQEYVIVFDTNVYLNLYEFSPHIAEFFIELISDPRIKDRMSTPI